MNQTGLVYRKEMLDILRDRRTLISMLVVPLLAMPAIIFGMSELTMRMVQKARSSSATIMILGAEYAPTIVERLGKNPLLEVVEPAEDYQQQISDKNLRAAIEFPEGFESRLAAEDLSTDLRVTTYYHDGEIRSEFARRTLESALSTFRKDKVAERLLARNVDAQLLEPFETSSLNVASERAVSGEGFGGFVPYMIILLTLQGAMYPATDTTAGEKERGTIETILASPVSRTSLAVGKFLMVLTVAIATAVLALLSLGVSSHIFASSERGEMTMKAGMSLAMAPEGVVAMLLMVLPVAVMFSGLLLAMALMAKSYKEAQSYTQPVVMIAILPAVASLIPGLDMNLKLALIPILNVSLASKQLLGGNYEWNWIAIIFASSCVYAGIAIAYAAYNFRRESVLFRT
jgi:sodium transport system permease protein